LASEKILAKKKEAVQELASKIKSAKTIVLTDFRGLTVEQDTELRKALREAGVKYKVVKNTITKFALNETGIQGLEGFLEGPTALAMHSEDPVAPAKLLVEYAKKYEKLELKAGLVEGRVVDVKELNSIASLPSKEVLIAKVLGGFNAPIAGFMNVLNANLRGLVVALKAIAEQKA